MDEKRREWKGETAEHECVICGKTRKRRYLVRSMGRKPGAYACRNVSCIRADATASAGGAA